MRSFIIFIFIVSLASFSPVLFAQKFDHGIFDQILQKYVKDGLVDYQSLKKNQNDLTAYLNQLEQVKPDEFQQWSKAEQKAFWINAYNAITIEGILRNYPIQWDGMIARARFPQNSIRQIGGFWDKVFVKIMGKDLTLNDIEHKILRKEFDDPRIHFAIVCASIGCPILESRAFFADNLEHRLEQSTRNFITNPEKVRLGQKENVLFLSAIFDWYKEDFSVSVEKLKRFENYSQAEQGIIEFVINYFPEVEQNYIVRNQPKIKYFDYDWSLNEQKK
ncbi:MAG TPA: DUF547 domain-containing protein [bacterium]